MQISREIVTDLWSIYIAGKASGNTRALIEEFLQQDAELAQILKARHSETKAPNQIRKLLNSRDWLLFFAILFSCLAFGRIISDTSWDVPPRNFIITATIAGIFWLALLIRTFQKQRKIYT